MKNVTLQITFAKPKLYLLNLTHNYWTLPTFSKPYLHFLNLTYISYFISKCSFLKTICVMLCKNAKFHVILAMYEGNKQHGAILCCSSIAIGRLSLNLIVVSVLFFFGLLPCLAPFWAEIFSFAGIKAIRLALMYSVFEACLRPLMRGALW